VVNHASRPRVRQPLRGGRVGDAALPQGEHSPHVCHDRRTRGRVAARRNRLAVRHVWAVWL
jgi:hypothetical protein